MLDLVNKCYALRKLNWLNVTFSLGSEPVIWLSEMYSSISREQLLLDIEEAADPIS